MEHFLYRSLYISLLAVLGSLLFITPAFASATAQATPAATATPAELKVPEGFEKTQSTTGYGSQVYDCVDGAWEFNRPFAALFDNYSGLFSGIHFGGPTWQSNVDGSSVVGELAAEVPAQNPARDVPLLLVSAAENTGSAGSDFGDTAFIQRLDTVGGAQPSGACTTGDTAYVPYRATYNFWSPIGSSY